jgi:hypothetical protein
MPVTINASSASSGTHDFEVEIPQDWDDFWDNIRSDGNDIALTDADGKSILNFQFKAGFNLPNRTLTLQAENINLGASNRMRIVQLYWNNPTQGSSLQTVISVSSVLTGHIYLGGPSGFVVKMPASGRSERFLQVFFKKILLMRLISGFQLVRLWPAVVLSTIKDLILNYLKDSMLTLRTVQKLARRQCLHSKKRA